MEDEEDPFWNFRIPQAIHQVVAPEEENQLQEPAYTLVAGSGFYYRDEEPQGVAEIVAPVVEPASKHIPDSNGNGNPSSNVETYQTLPSKSLQTLEAILQKVLRNLSVLADNFDRVVSSIEAEGRADDSRGWAHRVIKTIAMGLWNQVLHGARFVSEREKQFHSRSSSNIWACCIFILVFWLALAGFRTSFNDQMNFATGDVAMVTPAMKVQLPDGRSLAYQEQGASPEEARHQVLVVHGFLSSRLAGIPGINESLLEEYRVRLVSYDLPGFGESDIHRTRDFNTSAQDMELLADELGLGEKFWLLAYAEAAPHAWAGLKYIPHRLAGVALIAPGGNPYGGNAAPWKSWFFRWKLLHFIARRFPSILGAFTRKTLMNKVTRIRKSLYASVGRKDQALFEQREFVSLWEMNVRESMKQQSVLPLEQELLLLVNDWGFDLGEFKQNEPPLIKRVRSYFSHNGVEQQGLKLPIHVWQGTDDVLVPAASNEYLSRLLPQLVLHKLQDEGHFSWFYLCDECHRVMFQTLFGKTCCGEVHGNI